MTKKQHTAVACLQAGARVLTDDGYELVVALGRHTVTLESARGAVRDIPVHKFTGVTVHDGESTPVLDPLEPWWSSLPEAVQADALRKLEAVNEVLTGFRWGHPRLAMEGEPFSPFGDTAFSEMERCRRMAAQLTFERQQDRRVVERVYDGVIKSASVGARTVFGWIEKWREEGLRGLVDKRATRSVGSFERIPAPIRRVAEEVFTTFDGDVSALSLTTIETMIWKRLAEEGLGHLRAPKRLFHEYLSHKQHTIGRTTRQHSSRRLRHASSGHTSYPAMHPSHLALDVTRADVLVWDEIAQKPRSVEIITLISVATRVIVALRVTPRSTNAFEAGLVVYDAMRHMSMRVEGTDIDHFRWCGVPESIDLSGVAIHRAPQRVIPPGQSLQGLHYKPAVVPSSIRTDHGAIFLSKHFQALCRHFEIDLMLSRTGKPTDNAHVERWHETLQRAYQQLPGYKGRNPTERGRKVDRTGERLLTAIELEEFLHRFIALDYHRTWHQGLVLPGAPDARLTPLDMWDVLADVTGRITVPQHPDLIYQFLPIRWLTVGHAGVERKNMVYDAPVLKDFRDIREGTFKPDSQQVPFHYDPRDATRLWFRHPTTDRIHEIPWKARHLLALPMGDWVRDRAIKILQERGANLGTSHSTQLQLLDEIGGLFHDNDTGEERRSRLYSERLRFDRAQSDHDEAARHRGRTPGDPDGPDADPGAGSDTDPAPGGVQEEWLDEAWPDY
jgi:putative transposase